MRSIFQIDFFLLSLMQSTEEQIRILKWMLRRGNCRIENIIVILMEKDVSYLSVCALKSRHLISFDVPSLFVVLVRCKERRKTVLFKSLCQLHDTKYHFDDQKNRFHLVCFFHLNVQFNWMIVWYRQ